MFDPNKPVKTRDGWVTFPPRFKTGIQICLTCANWRDGIAYCCKYPEYPNHARNNVCGSWERDKKSEIWPGLINIEEGEG